MGVRQLGWMQAQELWAFDQLMRLRPDEGPDERLLIVAVTEKDIFVHRKWPLSDRTIAQLLEKLEQHQPRVIGLDMYRDFPVPPGNSELAKRLQQSDRVITVCKVSNSPTDSGVAPPPGVPEARIGFSDLLIDPGGILRRTLLFIDPPPVDNTARLDSHMCTKPGVYSLSLRLALHYLEKEKITLENTPSQDKIKLGSIVFGRLQLNSGGYQNNVNVEGYQLLLNYRSQKHVATQVTLTEVLTDKVNPNLIKNRIVLIGTTAESVKDKFYTPYSEGQQTDQEMPGVVIHAQAVSQILSAVLDGRPLFWYWLTWGDLLWIGVWSLVGGIFAWQFRHPLRFGLASGVALASLFAVCFGFFVLGGWIPLVPSGFAFLVTAGSVVLADRFNKTGYTQAIYARVKDALKINIKIDQSKKERQVAKITQTDYFQNLQKKGKELRNKRNKVSQENSSEEAINVDETKKLPQTPASSKTEYLQQMQNKVKKLKKRGDTIDD
ncbi:hypothetical protein BZZ01_03430 [Nostocales cyanobacterium HT-58-2]|nr:hypothetical protein BZZ01_03430 [Nostocales cyanobacterium HT-58-2]